MRNTAQDMDTQAMAGQLAGELIEPDRAFLRTLTRAERAAQADARHLLHRYASCMWESWKHLPDCPGLWAVWERGAQCVCASQMSLAEQDRREQAGAGAAGLANPAAVRGLVDLLDWLTVNVADVQAELGDEDE